MQKWVGCLLFFKTFVLTGAAQDEGTTFTYAFQPDQNERYKVVIELTGNLPMPGSTLPGTMKVSTEMFLKTKKVREDRNVELLTGLNDCTIEFNGQPFPIGLETIKQYIPDMEAVVSLRGEILEAKGGGQLPGGVQLPGFDPRNLITLFVPTILPEGALKTGQTWEFTPKVEWNGRRIPQKARFEGVEQNGDLKLLKIVQEFHQPIEAYYDTFLQKIDDPQNAARVSRGELKGTWTVWLDANKGLLHKAQLKAHLKQVSEPIKKEGEEVQEIERETTEIASSLQIERVVEKPSETASPSEKGATGETGSKP